MNPKIIGYFKALSKNTIVLLLTLIVRLINGQKENKREKPKAIKTN